MERFFSTARISAWIPEPPLLSEPPIVKTFPTSGVILHRLGIPLENEYSELC